MKTPLRTARRLAYGSLALALTAALSLPMFNNSASAAQVTNRSIQMSNSTAGATGVSYLVTFTPVANAAELIVEFCNNSPLRGDTCLFDTASVPTITGAASPGTGTAVGTGTPVHTARVTGLSMTAGNAFSVTLSGITNPTNSDSTFYARIYTYASGNSSAYVPGNTRPASPTLGTIIDDGGIAMSTGDNVSVTARIMESLNFCVSKVAPGAGCASQQTPTIEFGTGTPKTIDDQAAYTDTVFTQTSTNAASGAAIRMKNSNTCGGLRRATDAAGTCLIPAANSGSNTAGDAFGTGASGFGLSVTSGTGFTSAAPYAVASTYGMSTDGSAGVTTTYGSLISSSTAAVSSINNTLNFGARASTTAPAGVYTATMTLIATGRF